jgi:hypothetical protein
MPIQKIKTLTGAYAPNATSAGGDITITSGDGGATSGAAGDVNITAGERFDNAIAGAVTITGGQVDANSELARGGPINITGGPNPNAGQYAAGGIVNIAGGNSNYGGEVNIDGGEGGAALNGKGGDVFVTGGEGASATSSGHAHLRGGIGTATCWWCCSIKRRNRTYRHRTCWR